MKEKKYDNDSFLKENHQRKYENVNINQCHKMT